MAESFEKKHPVLAVVGPTATGKTALGVALAEQFGVSRPSLREAIQKLVAKGLLVSRQGGGNYVAESLGSTFSDPLLQLLEHKEDAQRDLLDAEDTERAGGIVHGMVSCGRDGQEFYSQRTGAAKR